MKQLAAFLKGIAILIGSFLVVYGFLGFLGFNPGGVHEALWIRLTGLYMALIGASYFVPNANMAVSPARRRWYYGLTLSPVGVVAVAAARTIFQEGWHDFLLQGGPGVVMIVMGCAIFAPLSLFLYKQGNPDSMRSLKGD